MEHNIQICLMEERKMPNILVKKLTFFEALKKITKNVATKLEGRGEALVATKKKIFFAASLIEAKDVPNTL